MPSDALLSVRRVDKTNVQRTSRSTCGTRRSGQLSSFLRVQWYANGGEMCETQTKRYIEVRLVRGQQATLREAQGPGCGRQCSDFFK